MPRTWPVDCAVQTADAIDSYSIINLLEFCVSNFTTFAVYEALSPTASIDSRRKRLGFQFCGCMLGWFRFPHI